MYVNSKNLRRQNSWQLSDDRKQRGREVDMLSADHPFHLFFFFSLINNSSRIIQESTKLPHWFGFVMPRPILCVLGSTRHVLLDTLAKNDIPAIKHGSQHQGCTWFFFYHNWSHWNSSYQITSIIIYSNPGEL